jgi:quercetin dioxygenase-like cupin family protein
MARPGDVIEHPITGERITFLRTAKQTGGDYLRIGLAVAPHGFVQGVHFHPMQEERFLIVSGAFDFVVDGKEFRVGPGGRVVVPAGRLHSWKNGGDTEAIAVIDLVPAFDTEECFEGGRRRRTPDAVPVPVCPPVPNRTTGGVEDHVCR